MKSHFKFSKSQRNGIFLLVIIIVTLQCIYFFVDFSNSEYTVNTEELKKYEQEIDSLKQIEIEERAPRIYPFNPNYITDYKGYTLGMSTDEIDRLLTFRDQGDWINSIKQFRFCRSIQNPCFSNNPLFRQYLVFLPIGFHQLKFDQKTS